MKYVLCVFLLCILLTLTSCTAEDIPALPDIPTAENISAPSAPSTPESNPEAVPAPNPEAAPASNPEAAPAPNSEAAAAQSSEAVPAPNSEPTPVSDSEEAPEPSSAPEFHEGDVSIDGVCFYKLPALTEAELEALWGPVRETERFQLVQDEQAEYRYYDGVTVCCTFYEDEAGIHYRLGALAYTRPDLAYVRGVRAGDTMETVLNTFRDSGERAPQETSYGPAAILYGNPQHMQSFGIVLYGDDSPVEIMYQEDGIGVIFTLDSEQKVSAIEVLGPLSAIQKRLRVV